MYRLIFIFALLFGLTAAACTEVPDYPEGADPTDTGATDVPDVADASDVAADTADTADAGPCGGACGGDTPHCLADTGQCVGCLADADCADGVCDTVANTCVECVGDADCPDGVCDVDGLAGTAHVCVGCLADADCPDGRCDTDASVGELLTCVECLDDADCAGGVCDPDGGVCVECRSNADCTAADASVCETATHTCTACTDNAGCTGMAGATVCDTSAGDGVCVECTVSDESACGGNSCDPATNACTTTPVGSVDTCGACTADSECTTDHRCIPMQFNGQDVGAYCLKTVASGCVEPPFGSKHIERESLSGAPVETYCGIPESLTTCPAVLDLKHSTDCSANGDADCGIDGVDDGRCETVGFPNRCTYTCTRNDECFSTTPCGRRIGSLMDDYCGGGN